VACRTVREPLHPAEHRHVVDLDTPLDEQLFDVAVAQVEAQVSADRDHDELGRELEPGKHRPGRCPTPGTGRRHHGPSLPRSWPASTQQTPRTAFPWFDPRTPILKTYRLPGDPRNYRGDHDRVRPDRAGRDGPYDYPTGCPHLRPADEGGSLTRHGLHSSRASAARGESATFGVVHVRVCLNAVVLDPGGSSDVDHESTSPGVRSCPW
jgi:hypothetical protein